jgi:hypothetical protein
MGSLLESPPADSASGRPKVQWVAVQAGSAAAACEKSLICRNSLFAHALKEA